METKKIAFSTQCKRMLADVFTPVGIYLRLRDRYPGSILLESTDFHNNDDSWSFICVQPIGGFEVTDTQKFEFKYPADDRVMRHSFANKTEVVQALNAFVKSFEGASSELPAAQSFFGYTSYDAIRFFEDIQLGTKPGNDIPIMRYRMYQYVIAINHFKDELYLCENVFKGLESELNAIETLIKNRDVPQFPFALDGAEQTNMEDAAYKAMVENGKANCRRGDVFQIVLSRRFQQGFVGDEFNVYRQLRSVNPSPYLFYFDYNDYKLFGSSPESQVIVKNKEAIIHPIAGTFRRTGDADKDKLLANELLANAKENAEHVMLVDLARNDLSRHASDVAVNYYRQVHYYSHVIHLVSEVTGKVAEGVQPFDVLSASFPAGTLSGAPKVRAMQLIDAYEPTARSYYGGAIGAIGLNGDINHAIMIRTFLSRQNTLTYQAGAGVVVQSDAASELQEVNHKLGALKKAIELAAKQSI
jgi:anthranilate synthase component I